MTKKSFALFALSLVRAEATMAQIPSVSGPVLFTCEGVSFRDFNRWDLAFRSLAYADHTAKFEIVRAPGKTHAFLQAQYSFQNEEFGAKIHARRTISLSNAGGLGLSAFGAFSESQQRESFVKTLLKVGNETYMGVPTSARFSPRDFREYITFPEGSDALSGTPIPVIIKITQASTIAESYDKQPVWSMLYRAECVSKGLSVEEYEARSTDSYRAMYGANSAVPSQRVALFPSLQGALDSLSIYSAEGELLAGKAARIGGAAVTATVATQLVRAVLARLARSPMVAAYFLPSEGTAKFQLDVKAAGLTAEQAQEFFAATSRTQEALCEQNDQYREFCRSVSALDFEIARQQGRAL